MSGQLIFEFAHFIELVDVFREPNVTVPKIRGYQDFYMLHAPSLYEARVGPGGDHNMVNRDQITDDLAKRSPRQSIIRDAVVFTSSVVVVVVQKL